MKLVRELFLCAARLNFTITAKHVPGKDNGIADALSRFNMQVFRQLAPHAHLTPVVVPQILLLNSLNFKRSSKSTKKDFKELEKQKEMDKTSKSTYQ